MQKMGRFGVVRSHSNPEFRTTHTPEGSTLISEDVRLFLEEVGYKTSRRKPLCQKPVRSVQPFRHNIGAHQTDRQTDTGPWLYGASIATRRG